MGRIKRKRIFFNKTFWRSKGAAAPWKFYCPLCGVERRISQQLSPNAWHFFQLALASVFFTMVAWPWFAWKGLVSFLPLWTVFEVAYRLRLRSSLPCAQCGFDPYLYLDDPERAKKEVDAYWRRKFAEKGIPYPEKGVQPPVAAAASGPNPPPQNPPT